MSIAETRDELALRMRVRTREIATTSVVEDELTAIKLSEAVKPQVSDPSFVVEGENGGLFLTAPASLLTQEKAANWEKAAKANPHYTYLQGRFVEADAPNRNNAYWTTADLEVGQPTVANGPLNWLHDERHIIGTLIDSELVYREAASEMNNHIVAMAAVWRFLYPSETQVIERASEQSSLWFSMECESESVTCVDAPGRPGCGETFPYATVMREPAKVCSHIREKSSVRRFDNPTFLGGAVIIPPVRPGWAQADAKVLRQAAELAETNQLDEVLSQKDAEQMVSMVIAYANGQK